MSQVSTIVIFWLLTFAFRFIVLSGKERVIACFTSSSSVVKSKFFRYDSVLSNLFQARLNWRFGILTSGLRSFLVLRNITISVLPNIYFDFLRIDFLPYLSKDILYEFFSAGFIITTSDRRLLELFFFFRSPSLARFISGGACLVSVFTANNFASWPFSRFSRLVFCFPEFSGILRIDCWLCSFCSVWRNYQTEQCALWAVIQTYPSLSAYSMYCIWSHWPQTHLISLGCRFWKSYFYSFCSLPTIFISLRTFLHFCSCSSSCFWRTALSPLLFLNLPGRVDSSWSGLIGYHLSVIFF